MRAVLKDDETNLANGQQPVNAKFAHSWTIWQAQSTPKTSMR